LTLTFGSLFAGIGGFDLGFERVGMVCKWQVEIDDYSTRVLAKHWPAVQRWADIKTFPPGATCDCWHVDIICGGFPCQDISYAGAGAGLDGERSGLFFEAIRVVRQLRPRYVVLENVAALLTRGLDRVLGELGALGYDAEWHCIPAAAVGAPHIRDRVFILAYAKGGTGWGSEERSQEGRELDAGANGENRATCPVPDTESKRLGTRRPGRTAGVGAGEEDAAGMAAPVIPRLEKWQRTKRQRAHAPITGSDWWATEPNVGRVANGVPARMDRLRGLGNAVVPQVAQWVGNQIVRHAAEGQT
jgi:DNA (cytosine-5)-methyltransferase 1